MNSDARISVWLSLKKEKGKENGFLSLQMDTILEGQKIPFS